MEWGTNPSYVNVNYTVALQVANINYRPIYMQEHLMRLSMVNYEICIHVLLHFM